MVVLQRNEVTRNRILYLLAIILSAFVLANTLMNFSGSSQVVQAFYLMVALVAVIALALSIVQLVAHPKRSQVLIFHRDQEMVVATNVIHEGFKLRFLRD